MSNENLDTKRWLIAIAAVIMQLCLGTVYAWSVFKGPLMSPATGQWFVISQAILYVILPQISSTVLFTVIACYLLACYGGGFATMPAFAADGFGPANIAKIYGFMLIAWSAAEIVGPTVFSLPALKPFALYVAAGLLVAGFLDALLYKKPEKAK